MARKRYTTEQIISLLRAAEVRHNRGEKAGAICRSLRSQSRATIGGGVSTAA